MSVEVRNHRDEARYEVWTNGQLAGFAQYPLCRRAQRNTSAINPSTNRQVAKIGRRGRGCSLVAAPV